MRFNTFINIVLFISLWVNLVSCTRKTKTTEKNCYENLCEMNNSTNYPKARINELLQQHKFPKKIWLKTIVEPRRLEISSKNSVLQKEKNLCNSRRVSLFPKFEYQNNDIMIVNQKQFPQKVSFEVCEHSGFCTKGFELSNYNTKCTQLYNNVRLLTLQKDQLQYRMYNIPSACVCFYEKRYKKTNKKSYTN